MCFRALHQMPLIIWFVTWLGIVQAGSQEGECRPSAWRDGKWTDPWRKTRWHFRAAVPLSDGTYFPILVSSPLFGGAPKAVINVHGIDRNADDYFTWALDSAKNAWQAESTIVVAPWFAPQSCSVEQWMGWSSAKGRTAAWSQNSAQWMMGGASDGANKSDGRVGVTSFEAFDSMLLWLTKKYPTLQRIFATGFSSGSQFGVHWTIMSPQGDGGRTSSGVPLTAFWGASSTFLYLDTKRPAQHCSPNECTGVHHNCTHYKRPSKTCFGSYDTYPRGLAGLGSRVRDQDYLRTSQTKYLKESSGVNTRHEILQLLRDRLARKDVIFMFGTTDEKLCTEGECNDSCGDQLTGTNRLQRGLNYMGHLSEVLSNATHKYHPKFKFFIGGHVTQKFTASEFYNKLIYKSEPYYPCLNWEPFNLWCWSAWKISLVLSGIFAISVCACAAWGLCAPSGLKHSLDDDSAAVYFRGASG